MKIKLFKNISLICLLVGGMYTSIAQTKLKAYALIPGTTATNGITNLWAGVGSIGGQRATSSFTNLNAGFVAQAQAAETVLGVEEALENADISIYQNYTTQKVVILNSGSHPIELIKLLNVEGKQMDVQLNKVTYNGKYTINTVGLTTGVYLVQVFVKEVPITKKIIIR